MALSSELASQLAKVINEDKKPTKSDTTVYGTVVEYDGRTYVKLDGSDRLTPVTATTSVKQDERVTVMIKDHSAIVTGNLSDPAASDSTVTEIGNQISEFEIIVADKVSTKELAAETARIDTLVSDNVYIRETLTANEAKFAELEAETAKIESLEADNVTINNTLTANKATIEQLEADIANIDAVSTEDLDAVNAKIHNLEGTYADFESTTTNKLAAVDAEIDRLDVDKLSATTADAMYANIDFSNIGKAAMEYFYATSGLIKDVKVGDATITGELIGVTIKGDLIEGNTIKAEKLVIKGSDGLYYKLNTDGVTTEAEQTEYNSLDGSHILANSITASKISVEDLVAFDATIGGFNISDSSIYSGVKETIGNTTRGVYLGEDGQFNFGDSNNYLKYFLDADGKYKLEIMASSVLFASGKNIEDVLDEVEATGISKVEVMYYQSTSSSSLVGGTWSASAPTWVSGKYIWSKTITTLKNGDETESTPVCITGEKGATGAAGKDGIDGAAGKDGADGIGVKSIVEEYYRSTSNTSQTGGSWSTTVPAWADDTYIWTRSTITYTDNTTKTTSPVCVTGAKGATGAAGKDGADGAAGKDGIGIKSVDVWYFLSTSSSSLKNGSWETTAPEWVDGKYMWSKTVTTYTDDTTTESTPVCITGSKGKNGSDGAAGADGSDGVGVESIVAEFYLSTSKDTQTGGSWVTTSPTWVSGTYLWTRSVITYTDGITKTTNPLCDSSWEAVNDINLGGTNLFRDTKTMTTQNGYVSLYGNPTVVEDSSGYGIATLPGDGTNDAICFFFQDTIENMVGKEVALSFDAISDALTTGVKQWAIYVGLFNSEGVRGKYAAISFLESDAFNHDKYTDSEWTRCKTSFVLPTADEMKGTANEHIKYGVQIFSLSYNTTNPIQIKKVKCEYGNKATEWSPAPEDVDKDINDVSSDLHTALTNQNAEITDNYTQAIMDALEDYNTTGDFNEFKNNVEQNLKNMANDISDNLNLTLGQIDNLNKDVQDKFSHFDNYVHIDNDAGTVAIGKGDGSVTLRIEADMISFLRNGEQFGWWDGVDFHTGNIVVKVEERAQLGNFAYVPRSDGSLSFLKVGG